MASRRLPSRRERCAMRFRYTILYVDDVAGTLDFFERAFGLDRAMLHEGGDYGELDTGPTVLAFSSRALMRELGKSPGTVDAASPVFEIAFETDDVAGAIERATGAGAELVQGAERMPWGQTVGYVRDPNGYLVELCTGVDGAP